MTPASSAPVWQGFDPTASFSCPVTILRADPACGAVFEPGDVTPVQLANPHAKILMVPAASHGVLASQPAAYLRHFADFLAKVLYD